MSAVERQKVVQGFLSITVEQFDSGFVHGDSRYFIESATEHLVMLYYQILFRLASGAESTPDDRAMIYQVCALMPDEVIRNITKILAGADPLEM
jgi:hypothetical protein